MHINKYMNTQVYRLGTLRLTAKRCFSAQEQGSIWIGFLRSLGLWLQVFALIGGASPVHPIVSPAAFPICLVLLLWASLWASLLAASPWLGFLDFCHLPVPALPLSLLKWNPLIESEHIRWMSTGPQSSGNDEVISLGIQFQGLEITIRGPAGRALDLANKISNENNPSSGSTVAASAQSTSQRSSFPPCPADLLALSSRLSAASILSPEQRIQRAWKCGC